MKLPDFKEHAGLNRLRLAMRAGYVELDWKLVGWDPFDKDRIIENLKRGIDVVADLSVIDIGDDSTLAVKGERILIYIRDVSSFGSKPKFHIAHCATLRGMVAGNRGHRYVVSKQIDGIFQINVNNRYADVETKHVRLEVCKNCLRELNWRGYRHAYGQWAKRKIFEGFQLKDFFAQYSETPTTWRPLHNNETAPPNAYPSNWNEISYKLRSDVGWRCQNPSCPDPDCQERKPDLHVHHIDGNKSNNDLSNLKVLCHRCHRRQPGHGHMARNPVFARR